MNKTYLSIIIFFIYAIANTQEVRHDTLNEVMITSSRIDLPFLKNSRTITIITSEEIQNSTATNLSDLLQEFTGIDVRRRGVDGMQSDIYIRGGNFNQTLILIDGIKTEDSQTGHHTMNVMMPFENIERIEIIKGSAARIFGQNAFTGAINIVTKKQVTNGVILDFKTGAYKRQAYGITVGRNFKTTSHQLHYSYNTSDGYRENTDFINQNIFLKSTIRTKSRPINAIISLGERKFGANNFYTNSPSFNEYEETQTSLVGVSTEYKNKNLVFKPKIYWKRNQDMFLLKREDPSFSRNFNISNKIGAELNMNYNSKNGITGFGIDIAKVSLSSNNLGDQNRTLFSTFLEHRFQFANSKLDITPGVSLNYYSDFDLNFFPGFDIGYQLNNQFRMYWNFGYSYRIPTYTELYINIPNFLSGNKDLDQEQAIAQEMGFRFNTTNFSLDGSLFYRVADNLIDYVKETVDSPFFLAQNLRRIVTHGFEINSRYKINFLNFKQQINLGYTFLEDDYKNTDVFASRYLINTSIKHHFNVGLQTQFFKNITQSISYKYVERPLNSYNVVNAKLTVIVNKFKVFALANNVFNTEYTEKDNVPMPKGNLVFGINYKFD